MKTRLFLTGVLIILCAPSAHAEITFADANSLYQKANYSEAAKAYEAVLKESGPTAALHYNLGNTYVRMGKKGIAALHYAKARRLSPGDKDLQWNEGLLRARLVDRLEPQELSVQQRILKQISSVGANGETAFFLTVSLIALLLIQTASYFSGVVAPPVRLLRAVAILIALLCAGILLVQGHLEEYPSAVVLSSKVTARFGPSDKETQAFILHEGAQARVLDETNKWVYLGLKNGQSGWIPKDACAFV